MSGWLGAWVDAALEMWRAGGAGELAAWQVERVQNSTAGSHGNRKAGWLEGVGLNCWTAGSMECWGAGGIGGWMAVWLDGWKANWLDAWMAGALAG